MKNGFKIEMLLVSDGYLPKQKCVIMLGFRLIFELKLLLNSPLNRTEITVLAVIERVIVRVEGYISGTISAKISLTINDL